MTESVIADFSGRLLVPERGHERPVHGRIVLSQRRLVLATDEGKTTIPLSSVFDIVVGDVPHGFQQFFNDSVTIAYSRDDDREVAVVESDADSVDRFVTVLFRAHLSGSEALVKHPARIGGRTNDGVNARLATLSLDTGRVTFDADDETFGIDLRVVSDFAKANRTLAGEKRPVIAVRHVPDGEALLSLISLPSGRLLNLLGRYLRLEYDEMQEELAEIDLSEDELEILMGIYSTGEDAQLASMLDVDPARLTMVLNSLEDRGLVVNGDVTKLSPMGRTVVNSRLEDVNT
jgi:helix-turn-helix protein